MNTCTSLIEKILAAEWRMFRQVKSQTPAACQQNPDAFHRIRGGVFAWWSEAMLAAYLETLARAEASGRNLLTEKYARMDNLIPPLTTNPRIPRIVRIEWQWQQEIKEHYPALFHTVCRGTDPTGDGSSFSVYLACELETYGDVVIDLYAAWVAEADQRGENLSLTMLERLVTDGGFDGLDHAEMHFKERIE